MQGMGAQLAETIFSRFRAVWRMANLTCGAQTRTPALASTEITSVRFALLATRTPLPLKSFPRYADIDRSTPHQNAKPSQSCRSLATASGRDRA